MTYSDTSSLIGVIHMLIYIRSNENMQLVFSRVFLMYSEYPSYRSYTVSKTRHIWFLTQMLATVTMFL